METTQSEKATVPARGADDSQGTDDSESTSQCWEEAATARPTVCTRSQKLRVVTRVCFYVTTSNVNRIARAASQGPMSLRLPTGRVLREGARRPGSCMGEALLVLPRKGPSEKVNWAPRDLGTPKQDL